MGQCKRCGRKGLFLKVTDGLCDNCTSTLRMEQEQSIIQGNIDKLQADLNDEKALYEKIETAAKKSALAKAEQEQVELLRKIDELKAGTIKQEGELCALQTESTKAENSAAAALRKVQRGRELVKAIQHVEDEYENNLRPNAKTLLEETENFLQPTVILNLHCVDMRELRKRYRQNEKNIKVTLEKYQGRYTTKANSAIYSLMVIALAAELQNVLYDLGYGKLDDALQNIKKITDKYLSIATDGNQSIAGTMKKFIGEIDYYFQEAVRIEYEYYVQKERAKEEQRAIREQMRQEAEERRELERQQKQIEKEESKFHSQIEQINAQISECADDEKLAQLQQRLSELEQQLVNVAEQKTKIINLQNGKAGNVYIISNIGSFGDGVFKIGMTRRLNPQERVDELGSASVPFPFDVHSMIFSDDAVSLETELHHILNDQRVNKVNLRKEFFKVSLDEVETLVEKIAPTAEFKRTILAEQYKQSLSIDHIEEIVASESDNEDDE